MGIQWCKVQKHPVKKSPLRYEKKLKIRISLYINGTLLRKQCKMTIKSSKNPVSLHDFSPIFVEKFYIKNLFIE